MAVKVTFEPDTNPALQVPLVHVMPEGALVTVPPPDPLRVTVIFFAGSKSAATDRSISIEMVHGAVLRQSMQRTRDPSCSIR